MDDNERSLASGGAKTAGSRSKTSVIPTSTRLQRNQAEKERRDKLNGFISELATLVPMVSNASKPLDKVSILRLAAAEMRLHFSCLNPKKYKKKPLVLPPAIMASLDLIEKTIGGFIIVTTLSGLIVFCSRSIEDYLGYQNIDVMGNKVLKYIYEDDIKYFESRVNSVVNSLKKSNKKKTKVIKAHMLQKPLPRSNETSRPRNMIFKISVHQNDTSENSGCNGSNNQPKSTRKRRAPKDFGYSAVVLMFVEPVRLEPEVDITYIDSNQDIYFTRHGLQGEIIYADQRISTITGYMPHDVQGTSAYQYICSSDVPIALFAQKAMFTSTDGKGVIVYRLRIRDMRFIYMQSSGQIAYKESSNEISHFVCFNRLLSEEEGSQELKKFQQRYAPQIMAAKMLQVKQGPGSRSPTTDLAYEQVMTLMNSSTSATAASPAIETSSYQCSKASAENYPDVNDQKPGEKFMSASNSLIAPNSIHSPEGHSTNSNNSPPNTGTLDYYQYYDKKQMDIILERPEQREGGGPLRRNDCATFTSNPYESMSNIRKKNFISEPLGSCVNKLNHDVVIDNFPHLDNIANSNGPCGIQQQNGQYDSVTQNKTMHSVNVYNCLQNSLDLQGSKRTLNDPDMNLIFHAADLQNSTSYNLTASTVNSMVAYTDQSNDFSIIANEKQNKYMKYSEQDFREKHFATQNNQQQPEPVTQPTNMLYEQVTFNNQTILERKLSQKKNMSSHSQVHEISPLLSLLEKSHNQLSLVSDISNEVDYCHNMNSYHNGSYNNNYLPNSAGNYNGANTTVCNGIDNLNSKMLNLNSGESLHDSVLPVKDLDTLSAIDTFGSTITSLEMTTLSQIPQKTVGKKADLREINFPETGNVKAPLTTYKNGNSNGYSSLAEHDLTALMDWVQVFPDAAESADLSINDELYQKLDSFFQSFPESNVSQVSGVTKATEFTFHSGSSSSNYPQTSISSEAKTICHD